MKTRKITHKTPPITQPQLSMEENLEKQRAMQIVNLIRDSMYLYIIKNY
ncbi:unnamed protein product [Paramecium octaurelia]|uniref:Uncharacterized protein n=1 Tax=Paramecium octaurelia TaxID=43137 RepID=A0A8S1WTG6_PAROT|nr:unnamed protein product [Paramecium octaurelia]